MRDFDVDLEPGNGRRSRGQAKSPDPGGTLGSAIEAGRPDVVGTAGLLHMQRLAGNSGVASFVAQRDEAESPVKDIVRSPGSPLDNDTRSDMESRLGHDFGDVRVHTDADAGASARSVQAHAYTVGNHVVFGDGTYQPGSDQGKRTLAHELTHVVQQRSGPVDGSPAAGGISVSHPADRFEQEAERTADLAMSPASADASAIGPTTATAGSPVQREENDDAVQGLFVQREPAAEEEQEDDTTVAKLDASVQREATAEEEEEPAAG